MGSTAVDSPHAGGSDTRTRGKRWRDNKLEHHLGLSIAAEANGEVIHTRLEKNAAGREGESRGVKNVLKLSSQKTSKAASSFGHSTSSGRNL